MASIPVLPPAMTQWIPGARVAWCTVTRGPWRTAPAQSPGQAANLWQAHDV